MNLAERHPSQRKGLDKPSGLIGPCRSASEFTTIALTLKALGDLTQLPATEGLDAALRGRGTIDLNELNGGSWDTGRFLDFAASEIGRKHCCCDKRPFGVRCAPTEALEPNG